MTMARCKIVRSCDHHAGHLACCLAALALLACTPLPRGTTLPAIQRAELENAFAQCETAEVIEDSPRQYYVLACDRIAIYQCDSEGDPEQSLCTCVAAGDPADVLSRDRSLKAKKKRADWLFERGREMANANRKLEACDLFAESDTLRRTFGSAFNLGDCAANRGHAERAWELYNAAATVAAASGDERLARSAYSQASVAATKLCTLHITIPDASVGGLTVRVGRRSIVPAPTIHTAVEPATIAVVVEALDVQPFTQTVRCTAGANIPIVVPGYRRLVASPGAVPVTHPASSGAP